MKSEQSSTPAELYAAMRARLVGITDQLEAGLNDGEKDRQYLAEAILRQLDELLDELPRGGEVLGMGRL